MRSQTPGRVTPPDAIAPERGVHTTGDREMKQTKIPQGIDVEFALERTTKNTYRYAEQSEIPEIGTLYIQKFALGAEPPQRLRVCVEAM